MSPKGLMEDLRSSGRRAHCFNTRTPACFDVGQRSSRLGVDERVYITPSHLISHETCGKDQRFDICPHTSVIFIPAFFGVCCNAPKLAKHSAFS